MSRYKQFSCDHLDNRVISDTFIYSQPFSYIIVMQAKSALLDQRLQYNDLMEKMRKYYKPDGMVFRN